MAERNRSVARVGVTVVTVSLAINHAAGFLGGCTRSACDAIGEKPLLSSDSHEIDCIIGAEGTRESQASGHQSDNRAGDSQHVYHDVLGIDAIRADAEPLQCQIKR